MIPLRDLNPTRVFPAVTLSLLVVNALVFFVEVGLQWSADPAAFEDFVMTFSLRPFEVVNGVDLPPTSVLPVQLTVLTSMFMHGGWLHIIGNMWYLWIFGNNIEEQFGHFAYLALYLLWGFAAAAAQVAVDPASRVPMLGASGAVAGVLGAYVILYPRARVEVLLTIGIFMSRARLPALIVIGFWIVLQFLGGVLSLGELGAEGGVAYFAHIGGAVAGVLVGIFARHFSPHAESGQALDGGWR